MPYVRINDAELYYEVHGKGPPVVLSHGLGANHITWWHQVLGLRDEFTVVTFDHRGFGLSGDDGRGATVFVDDLVGLLDHLEIAKTALVGQSMGGFTTSGFAARFPSRVTAYVMACSPGGLLPKGPAPASPPPLPKSYAEMTYQASRADGFINRRPDLFFLFEQLTRLNDRVDIAKHFARMGEMSTDPRPINAAKFPVLLLSAEEDASLPAMERVKALIPRSEFHVVPGTGHLFYFEQPDVFNRLVRDFLTKHLAV